jgi:hypothetical protein
MTVRYARLLRMGFEVDDDLVPRLEYAQAVDTEHVELSFNTAMTVGEGTDIEDPTTYSIEGLSIFDVSVYSPSRIRLRVSDMVLGQTYTVAVGSALQSVTGRALVLPSNHDFTGLAVLPTLIDANPLLSSEGDNIRVTFSAPMLADAALLDPANYSVISFHDANPVDVLAVTPEGVAEPTYVDLTVSPMDNGGTYGVTAVNLHDAGGNLLDPAQAYLAFIGYRRFVHPTIISALALDHHRVAVHFSSPMLVDAALLTPQNFVVSGGLQVLGVNADVPDTVSLQTSNQVGGKQYRLSVNTTIRDFGGTTVDENNNAALLEGVATPTALTVGQLRAFTHPDGRRIDLKWNNPDALFTHIKIVRRTRGVPFDAQDGTPIFEGEGTFDTYSDTQGLQDNTFYYYAVLLSDDGVSYTLDANTSTVECLAIRPIQSAQWLRNNALPAWVQERALTLAPDRDLLNPVVRTLGAALDLMRGELEAYRSSANQDVSASSLLGGYNRTLNFEPEASFDMAALRRLPLHLLNIYKAKTTAPALIQLVKVLTMWNSNIVEFGDTQGGSLLRTYDGASSLDRGQGDDATLTIARGQLVDSSKAWPADKWQNGYLEDALGHIIGVTGNTADTLTLAPAADPVCLVNGLCSAGTRLLVVNDVGTLRERGYIQISDDDNAQVAQIFDVDAVSGLTLQEPLQYTFGPGARVYILTDILDGEVTGTGTVAGNVLTDATKLWVSTQWRGYKLLTSDNAVQTIVASTANSVTVPSNPVPGPYAIAKDFVLGPSFADHKPVYGYTVYEGSHNLTFEPLNDLTLAGTLNDPYKRTYAGLTSLGSGFTNDDFAIFIERGVAAAVGRVGAASVNTIEDAGGALVPHSLQGMYLNPNRKQTQLFEIVDNDEHVITVNRSLAGLATEGDFYFVLKQRDALRYNRLNAVIPQFIPRFTRAFLAFT